MASEFSELMRTLDYPMMVVTVRSGDEMAGCLVGFTTQTSIDPARFLVCISEKNHTHRIAADATALAVHVLPDDRKDLAEIFGGQTDDDPGDKLDDVRWSEGFGGVPIIEGCDDWFAGRILERVPLGDHTGHLIEPVEASSSGSLDPLAFDDVQDLSPGHRP